ncbi:MAG TPA: primosomal protein N', partial [Pelolinea sp.]|nr:primosomal protein N' [Pelolinea sp.]
TLLGEILPGCLVEAPFGRQTVQGVVIKMLDQPGVAETRQIISLLEDLPALTAAQLELAARLSEEYLSPISEFISLMLPPGLSQRSDTLYSLNLPAGLNEKQLTELQRRLVERLREKGPQRGRQLEDAFRHVDWRRSTRALMRKGLLLVQPVLPRPSVSRKTTRLVSLAITESQLDDALSATGREGSAARIKRQAILRLLAGEIEPLDSSYIYASTGASSADLNYLHKKGFIRYRVEEVLRDPLAGREVSQSTPPKLTRDQWSVWQRIEALMEEKTFKNPVLLHGVTGSGKTELYMRTIEKSLKASQQAIVLVPEISLTPQTIERFTARFGGQVGVIHSKLSPGERYDTWRRSRSADFSIAIGPRSALFTPFPDIGVIVLDEFHDQSYTQTEISPYYHAVEAAIEMGRLNNCLVLLGSATPDVGTYYRAVRENWPLFELPERILAHSEGKILDEISSGMLPLPEVSVVDMRAELQAGNMSIFSLELTERIKEVLSANQQAILLLNRRGSATWVFCRDCGHTLKCPRCDLSLTYHSGASKLVCHTCGYARALPRKCPSCGSARIKHFGTGTEKVEYQLQALFPSARLLRWDADSASGKGAEEVILTHFRQHNADILIGTQMLAKGLDLPLVTLVGVVLADVGLNFPDFRTAERTFQLLTQVAGRAGRSALGGRVVLQTFQPEHYAIRYAAAHDFKGFYEKESDYRRELRYPPFTRMVRFETRELKNDAAHQSAQILHQRLNRLMTSSGDRSLELIGPVPPYFARRGGYYRWQVILKGSDPLQLIRGEDFSGIRVEVDPPSLL